VASESICRRLRDRLYDQLQHLPCSYHDDAETGDLVQRCTSDVETIRMFLSMEVVEIGRGAILLLAGIPILLALHPRLAAASLATVPVIVAFASVFFLMIRRTFKRMDESEGEMTTMLQENLTGIRVVRAFARQDFEREKFAVRNAAYRDRWFGVIRTLGWYWPCSDVLCITQLGVVLIYGASLIERGELSVGQFYFFFECVNTFLWPVRHMGRILADLGKATVSIDRTQAILDAPREAAPEAPSGPPERVRGGVEFENLSFSHGAGAAVLDNVSFRVEPGQMLAILGPSGSGKSTLVNLLLRLYDYRDGSIRVDGVELIALDRKYVRSQIGVVMQEPFLYSKSLRENIKLGRSAAHDEEMLEVAASACIHEAIASFEHGYDTVVGERGVTLSGGQRQRVAIARALLKEPAILILDDALSAVDTRTESMILAALRRRRGRHTTLVIAHRLSTLKEADNIIVLEGGRIVQAGSHDALIARDGLYRRLWHIQSSLEADLGRRLGTIAPAADPGE
jgi:ATP-binding cassette subfamily B protein